MLSRLWQYHKSERTPALMHWTPLKSTSLSHSNFDGDCLAGSGTVSSKILPHRSLTDPDSGGVQPIDKKPDQSYAESSNAVLPEQPPFRISGTRPRNTTSPNAWDLYCSAQLRKLERSQRNGRDVCE